MCRKFRLKIRRNSRPTTTNTGYQVSATRSIIGKFRLIPTNLCTAGNITATHTLILYHQVLVSRKKNKRRIHFPIAEGLLFRSAVTIFRDIQHVGLLVVSSLCWYWASCIFVSVTGDHMQAWSIDVCVCPAFTSLASCQPRPYTHNLSFYTPVQLINVSDASDASDHK